MTVLVLSGTTVGRRAAVALHHLGLDVLSSLPADSVDELPPGRVRRGGFGGEAGFAECLRREGVTAVVDATHPYARTMTRTAHRVCQLLGIPIMRFTRPSWSARADARSWTWVDSHQEACRVAGQVGAPVLLGVGRQPLWHYHLLPEPVTARVFVDDGFPRPAGWRVVEVRGALDLQRELAMLRGKRVMVVRDLGGDSHAPKLVAAAQLGVHVVMLRRPAQPGAQTSSLDDLVAWVAQVQPS
ncbi:precorrin-6A/cobalt-precorrin-6A reductase [Luteococcus sp. Sow4_B9]|uniref:precorrin-6A/cobalt-precorrin-6A reductase n=1 Tax=Luteococcus sp. Sow4_B9 TaxID=3438792 RepID=UPI003F957193